MFVANSAWLLTRKRLTQIQLWSFVFQALPFHYSSEYKVGLHFLTQWRQSKHLLILGSKCLWSEMSVHRWVDLNAGCRLTGASATRVWNALQPVGYTEQLHASNGRSRFTRWRRLVLLSSHTVRAFCPGCCWISITRAVVSCPSVHCCAFLCGRVLTL